MESKDYKIIEFDPTTATDKLFDKVLDLTDKLSKEKRSDEPRPPRELIKRLLRSPNPERKTCYPLMKEWDSN